MEDPLASCPLNAALEVIGGTWQLIVLYALASALAGSTSCSGWLPA